MVVVVFGPSLRFCLSVAVVLVILTAPIHTNHENQRDLSPRAFSFEGSLAYP